MALLWAVVVLGAALVGRPAAAAPAAHPAPSVLHDYVVTLTAAGLTVESYLRISPELVPEVYRQIDTDSDGQTSAVEQAAWVAAHPAKLRLALDEVAVPATMSAAPPLSRDDLLVSITHPIRMTYTVAAPAPLADKHRILLTYGDNYLAYDEYSVSVAGDQIRDGKPQPIAAAAYPATYQIVYHIPPAGSAQPNLPGELAAAPWTAGLGVVPSTAPQAPQPQLQPQPGADASNTGMVGQILDAVRGWRGDWGGAAGLLALALALGALHALTPGHGKAMVAAYLVGTRGRVRDAALLGGVVTATHTAGVFALGLVLSAVSQFSLPRALQPALELVAGGLVVVMGLYLLLTRWRDVQTARAPQMAHAVAAAAVPVPVGAAVGAGATTLPIPASEFHSHDYNHSSDHDHDHSHSHGSHSHSHAPVGKPEGLRTILGLGVSGGLVPCPDALAILLLAASVGQVGLGLGLVTAFSLGLAAVLIGIGVALVTVKGALSRSRSAALFDNPLWTRWVPLASALVVVVVGLLMVGTALAAQWG